MSDSNGSKEKRGGFVSKVKGKFQRKKNEKGDVPPLQTEAPATVYFQGQKLKFGMEPVGNTLVLKAQGPEAENAATRIQSAFRRFRARELYQQMKALQGMQLEVTWPAGSPFIGILAVRVKTIADLHGVKHPILRAKCDGDQSVNVPGWRDEYRVIRYDSRATFCFVIVRSSTVMTIEVLQSLELATRILGKVQLPVATLPQGVQERSVKVVGPNGKEVGTMRMNVGYEWVRDTQDFGGYEGPDFVIMPSRKFRGSRADQVVERLWKVNHWLCSHDNIWCTKTSFANLVTMAVEKKKEEEQDLAIMTAAGQWEAAPLAVVPELKREVSRVKELSDSIPESQSTLKLITAIIGSERGQRRWESFDASTKLDGESLGIENWEEAMVELSEVPLRDDPEDSAVFDLTSEMEAQLNNKDAEADEDEEDSVTGSGGSRSKTDSAEEGLSRVKGEDAGDEKENCSDGLKGMKCDVKHKKQYQKKGLSIPAVTGKFEYGAYRPASKRSVHLLIRRAENSVDVSTPKPIYLGAHNTTRQGRLFVELPERFHCHPGHYHVLGLLPDDNTFGRGSMYMLEPGSQCVVFDLDGTITTSDAHVVAQVLLDSVSVSTVIGSSLGRNYDLKQRAHALSVCRAWAAKGYQVIYLSGRQGSAYNMTAQWLIRHGYPPGPIHLTRTHLPTLPVYVSVGHFKVKYMKELMSRGLEIFAAYGNTGTDIRAYERVGIPKERTFIVGPNGGKQNTVKVPNFTSHLVDILKFPNASKPIPYTELLFNAPEHRG